jgi:hypothetical protein
MRGTLQAMGERGKIDADEAAAWVADLSEADRARLRPVFASAGVPDERMKALLDATDLSYQLLQRSGK